MREGRERGLQRVGRQEGCFLEPFSTLLQVNLLLALNDLVVLLILNNNDD